MKTFKILFFLLLSFSLLSGAASSGAQTKKKRAAKKSKPSAVKKTVPPTAKTPVMETRPEDFKILAQGSMGEFEEPFVFVARDPQTYAQLQTAVKDLPDASAIDFTREAVVAAFAGTKPTAGWEVLIRRLADRVLIDVSGPRKDMLVAEVLTMPYKIAVVPVEEEKPLALETAATWTSKIANYRLAKGTFSYSGGLAPRQRLFGVEGTIGVMTSGNLVTMIFNLTAKGDNAMKLAETASGIVKDGAIHLPRLDAGTFSEGPKPPVNVSGTLSEARLVLRFEPNPTKVADGFEARGAVEAVKETK